jgi:hypothetical protein
MIVNKTNVMEVVAIKLTSGEEIVGSFLEENSNTIKLRKPLALAMTQQGPALAPFFMTGDINKDSMEIEFNKNTVIAMTKPHKQFKDVYTQSTSGITIAENSSNFKM